MWYRRTGHAKSDGAIEVLQLSVVDCHRNSQSAFGTPPDLKGRYASGPRLCGPASVRGCERRQSELTSKLPFNLLAKSPYELDLSSTSGVTIGHQLIRSATLRSMLIDRSISRKAEYQVGQNDDAPFSTSDLEKVLRGWDADSGTLPSRLWDVVNDFDPVKLMRITTRTTSPKSRRGIRLANQIRPPSWPPPKKSPASTATS